MGCSLLWPFRCDINVGEGFVLFGVLFVGFSINGFEGMFCWMGKQPKATNRPRGMESSEQRGPLPKANSKSLKLASQPMKNAVVPPRWMKCRLRGRKMKKQMIVSTQRSLVGPLETTLLIA